MNREKMLERTFLLLQKELKMSQEAFDSSSSEHRLGVLGLMVDLVNGDFAQGFQPEKKDD